MWNIKHRPGRQPHCGDQLATPSAVARSELLRCRLPLGLRVTFHDREQFLPTYTRPCPLFKIEMRAVPHRPQHIHTHPGSDTRDFSHLFLPRPPVIRPPDIHSQHQLSTAKRVPPRWYRRLSPKLNISLDANKIQASSKGCFGLLTKPCAPVCRHR